MAAKTYITVQGDFWDLIALKVYGHDRGDEKLMAKLLEANYELQTTYQFSGGVQVVIPKIDEKAEVPLVPWKRSVIGAPVTQTIMFLPGGRGKPGEPGAPGPPGRRGSFWYTGTTDPTSVPNQLLGDLYLNVTTGDVFTLA